MGEISDYYDESDPEEEYKMGDNEYTTWTVTLEVPAEHSDWFYAQIDTTGELNRVRELTEVDIEYRLRKAVKAAGRSFEVQAKVTQDGE